MKQAVRDAFWEFTLPMEGCTTWLYSDVLGYVTVGVGNLVDPVEAALMLPFRQPDGTLATKSEIAAEWMRVKNDPKSATLGANYTKLITRLRLLPDDVRSLVLRKLDDNDRTLSRRFNAWESWPADAQLGTHALAWAVGAGFHFPRLEGALRACAFRDAADEAHLRTDNNPGVVPRNLAMRTLFKNAAEVMEQNLDPEVLYWPKSLDVPAPASTEPELPES